MVDFSKLRTRSQNGQSGMAALQKKIEATSGYSGQKDDRFWKWTFDAKGNSESIVRLLPIPYVDMVKAEAGELDGDELTPAARIVSHWFQGPGGWYKENSLQTFGEDCPVRQMDTPNWKVRNEMGKETVEGKAYAEILKKRLPSEDFICGLYVVRDKNAPENEGKVFLFKYGRAIDNILKSAAKPQFDNIEPIDPFDIIEGANLILNLTSEEKTFNGRTSRVPDFKLASFGKKGPLFESDELMEEVWKKQYSIMEFYDRKNFKTYEALKTLLCKVMNLEDDFSVKGAAPRKSVDELAGATNLLGAAPKEEEKPKLDEKPPVADTVVTTEQPVTKAAEPVVEKVEPPKAESAGDELDEFERLLAGA